MNIINGQDYKYEKDIDGLLFTYKNSICLILRNTHMGHLCGYVGVPEGRKFYRAHYDTISNEIDCDIELTWSGFRLNHQFVNKYKDLWWVGFDCGHFNEWMPKMPRIEKYDSSIQLVYRSIPWVMEECKKLVDVLEIKNNTPHQDPASNDMDELGIIRKELQEHALSLLSKGRLAEVINNDYVCEQAMKIANLATRLEDQRKFKDNHDT